MNHLRLLKRFSEGLIAPLAIIEAVMCFSMLLLLVTLAQISFKSYECDTVAAGDIENAYYVSINAEPTEQISRFTEGYETTGSRLAAIAADPEVERVIATVTLMNARVETAYGDVRTVSITFFDDKMLEMFPGLISEGMRFTDDPYSCLLATPALNNWSTGDTMNVIIGDNGTSVQISVAGHMRYPYQFITLQGGGNLEEVSLMFESPQGIFMRYDKDVVNELAEMGGEIAYSAGYIVKFAEEPNPDVVFTYEEYAFPMPITDMLKNSQTKLRQEIIKTLPRPLFFIATAFIAFISTTILLIKKKERELGVYYLCGLSRVQCLWLELELCLIVTAIPVILSAILVKLVPELQWTGRLVLGGYRFSMDSVWITAGCFVLAAVIIVLTGIRKRSPIESLKGAVE